MTHGSLFSGIGGFDLASEWMGWENVFQVENNKFCNIKLTKNFPNTNRHGDIKEFDGTQYRGIIDILTGGFPCQPFSVAGKQKGQSDDRHLWPEMLRVIREVQPAWIVGENVPGIIRMELENICVALESEGYAVQPFIIPSASIGSWDKRERVWIIAYNNSKRLPKSGHESKKQAVYDKDRTKYGAFRNSNINKFDSDNPSGIGRKDGIYGVKPEGETGKYNHYFKESDWWKRDWIEVASELCGSNARVPHRMDRIKALGNSVNPYVPYQIFKAIEEYNEL